jgi:hypothetical protein
MKHFYNFIFILAFILKLGAQPPVSLLNVVNNSCMNTMDGSATFSINGFDFPYTATLSGGCSTVTFGGITTSTFTMNGIGNCLPAYTSMQPDQTYNLALYDNMNNAAGFLTFTITSANPWFLLQTSMYKNISCPGANDGFASWTTAYGTPPFTYLWSTATNTNYSTSQSISNVSPGVYSITATDANGCKLTWTSTFTEPYLLNTITNATAPGCCNGNISPYVVGIMPSTVSYSYTPAITNTNAICAGNYTLTATSPSCTIVSGFSISCITGVDELEKPSLKIYPNPATDEIHLEFPEGYEGEDVIITNCTGQTVMHSPFKKDLNISELPQGIYFINVTFPQGINYHSKFIKE